jgi:branched-chain amino acid transport system substrate-binding protein
MNVRSRRALAVVMLSSAFVSACGLKPEVKDQLAQAGGVSAGAGLAAEAGGTDATGVDPLLGDETAPIEAGVTDPATGEVVSPDTSGTTGGGTGGSGGGTAGSTGGGGGGSTPAGGGGAGPAGGGDTPGNTTGIDMEKKVVNIALHGPLTGAGVPQESFRSGTPKYWKGRKLANGFSVNAVAIDDKYDAQGAARACAEAAGKYFLVVGGAGTDQIQACGQQQKMQAGNVPYLSSGVTENGLGGLKNYFATSLTYKQQGPLVVQAAQEHGYFDGKWAVVITDTPNFKDARDSITAALQKAGAKGKAGAFNPSPGADVYLTDKAPRDCATLAGQLRGGGYNTIYFLGQPSFFIQCVGSVGPGPTYTGPGPSFGVNSIGGLACRASGGTYKGFYLHPATGMDQAGKRAPGVQFQDDIEYSIYGAMQGLEKAFNQVQGNLTREKFIATLAKSSIPAGILPAAVYNGGSRFGGTAAFLLKSNCQTGQYQTVKEYKIR